MAQKMVETPLMKQYVEMKAKHPDAILLFRVGDFYETFSTDALEASEILGITLTRRANGVAQYVELAGFPHHALDTYLPKLIRAGVRVGFCDQLDSKVMKEYPSDEKEAKPETDETKVQEKSKPSEDIETLKAQHKKEIETLKAQYEEQMKDLRAECEELEQGYNNFADVRLIINESIEALKGEIPSTLADCIYNSLGKLEVIKIKYSLDYRLTTDEISYLIEEASKSQNKQN